jgi:acyl-CoA thioester hydrolase
MMPEEDRGNTPPGMTGVADLLGDYPVVVTMPVAWGDMDAFRHVNNIQYLKYWESARIRYFETIGLVREMGENQVGPILASTSCVFRFPLTYPDTVSVGCRVVEMREDRFLMHYVIVSHREVKVAARGDGMIVAYDYGALRKTALPDTIRGAIARLEGQGAGAPVQT